MVPVAAGFSAVFKIGIEEFQYWRAQAGIDADDEAEIFALLQFMLGEWEQNKENSLIQESDILYIQSLGVEEENG
jgi:hypothetical protein